MASSGSGKPASCAASSDSIFDERYLTTIGVKIDRKQRTCSIDAQTCHADAVGHGRSEDDLAQLNVSHLRGASGYILVADGCRAGSLEKAVELEKRIREKLGLLPFVLVVNKFDLRDQWEVKTEQVARYGWPTFETSARTGSGVEEMFLALAATLIRDHSSNEDQDEDKDS